MSFDEILPVGYSAFLQKKIENRLNLWYIFIDIIMFGKGVARMTTGATILTAQSDSALFPSQAENCNFLKGFIKDVICPFYRGRDAPFSFFLNCLKSDERTGER